MWTRCSGLGCRDPGCAGYTGELVAVGAGAMVHSGCSSLASGSSVAVRIEQGGGAAAWIMGTLVAPTCRMTAASGAGARALVGFFWPLAAGVQRASLAGVLLYGSAHQALKGPPSLGSLLFNCWCWRVARERLQ